MSDTQPFRILRAGQPVNKHSQHALLSNLPFDVEDLEAQRTCHPLGRLSNLFQLHAIPTALFIFAQNAGLETIPRHPQPRPKRDRKSQYCPAHGLPISTPACPATAGTTGIDAPASRHPSRPTKKWACAHWLMRPVWKQPSIISSRPKRKNSRLALATPLARQVPTATARVAGPP